MIPACLGAHVHSLLALLPESTGSDRSKHEHMTSDIMGLTIFMFTVNAERANKINHFLYYYIFSLYFVSSILP